MGKVEHLNIMKDSAVSQILNIIFCRRELKFIDATKTKGERANRSLLRVMHGNIF